MYIRFTYSINDNLFLKGLLLFFLKMQRRHLSREEILGAIRKLKTGFTLSHVTEAIDTKQNVILRLYYVIVRQAK